MSRCRSCKKYEDCFVGGCLTECCGMYVAKDTNVPTNADHIRSMTDEELADFLDSVYCHGWSKGANDILDDDPYYQDRLKQPYGGDT